MLTLSTPGGGAASSEVLYIESRKLREEKPLVMVMGSLVASGGYMMAMGANYTYVKSSSLVGNVGVISFAGPIIPLSSAGKPGGDRSFQVEREHPPRVDWHG